MRKVCPLAIALLGLLSAALAAPPENSPGRQRRRTPVVEVFEKARDAVVNISTTRVVRMRGMFDLLPEDIFDLVPRPRDRAVQSIGSGVIVHESGYIVTNAHVVAQASDVKVNFADGSTESASVLAADAEHDLAVLKVDAGRQLPWQKLGRSDDLMVGETVVAIGNPLGLKHTVTAGIVSALDRDLVFNQGLTYKGLIQTDASINPGNSGGPLLNVDDELIGINTAIRGDAQNIGFAIPVDRLWELLPTLLDIERRDRVRFGLKVSGPAAEVLSIRPDSPAAKADLRPGDRLVRFNGEPIRDGIDYYVHLLGQAAGSEITLTIQRGGKALDTRIALQAIPLPDGEQLAQRLLGVRLGAVPARLRQTYGLPAHIGLRVEEVEPGSPAAEAGMLAGDLILRLDRVTTASVKDVGLALEKVSPGERVLVEGIRLQSDGAWIWPPVAIRTRS